MFKNICKLDDLWEGDMSSYSMDGKEVLLVWPTGGDLKAYQGKCPHQDIELAEGKFDGKVIMCRAHQWTFDGESGAGINPSSCKLAEYPVQISGEDVLVDIEGIEELFSHG